MPVTVHRAHESGIVRFRVCVFNAVVVRMTEHTRRLCSGGIVTACTLFNIVFRQFRVSSAATSEPSANDKSRNLVTRRQCPAESVRTVFVTIVAESPRIVTR